MNDHSDAMTRTVSLKLASVAIAFALALTLTGMLPCRAALAEGEPFSVSGLTLNTDTSYRVFFAPDERCQPAFAPRYATMEFDTPNTCTLTYEGEQIRLGRFTNDKYLDMFTMSDGETDNICFTGKCFDGGEDADLTIKVSVFYQGTEATPLFGESQPQDDSVSFGGAELVVTGQPEPVVFRAGDQRIEQGTVYSFRVLPDESCDVVFTPFTVPIKFLSELGVYFVTSQYKNVSSAYPASVYLENSGWVEFSAVRAKFWGMVDAGTDGADLSIRVVGMEGNFANLFDILYVKETPVVTPEPTPVPTPDLPEYDANLYRYYALLKNEEKTVYAQLSEALNHCEEHVALLTPVSNENLNRIFWCVLYDQPQIFWANRQYTPSYESGLVSEVRLYYNELADQLPQARARVDAAAQRILDGAKGMNATAAERYIHDRLGTETTYVAGCPHNQNIYSLLVNHETVCAGYARAFQYLMQRLNIPCCYCTGTTSSGDGEVGRHAWNLVELNGNWYNVDVTWDDFYGEQGKYYDCITYEYYNVTDRFIGVEHTRDEFSLRLPPCAATRESFEQLYGHIWQVEVARSDGISTVNTIDDYFKLCYQSLMNANVGDNHSRFILTNGNVLERLMDQADTKEFVTAYVKPYFKNTKLKGKLYYSYSFQYYGIGSRGNCYCVDLTQTLSR